MKKRTIVYLISALILIGVIGTSLYYYQLNKTAETKKEIPVETIKKDVTYKGQDGVTALVLLEKNAKIEKTKEGMVNSINGVTANSSKNEFWSFNVNGKTANEGAGTYITKNTETITWKIDTF